MITNNWNASPFADYDTAPAAPEVVKAEDGAISYTLRARKYSHWVLTENEEYIFPEPNKIATDDRWYTFDTRFSNRDTAFIIMDPWSDMACDFLNGHLADLTDATVVPMAQAAAKSEHLVIVLTGIPNRPYNSKIAPKLQDMADRGELEIIYHEDHSPDSFIQLLLDRGIKNLIYCGFFTNMCTLLRPLGIVRMTASGKFKVYFIPQASAAMEHGSSWESNAIHHATTLLIGQTQAKLLELDDIIDALK